MKNTLKTFILILSVSLVNCKKDNSFRTVELENELAIVQKITDYQSHNGDELFYLELVNKHAKLSYTALLVAQFYDDDMDVFSEQYKIEGLTVKISGFVLFDKNNQNPLIYGNTVRGIYVHAFQLSSIETTE